MRWPSRVGLLGGMVGALTVLWAGGLSATLQDATVQRVLRVLRQRPHDAPNIAQALEVARRTTGVEVICATLESEGRAHKSSLDLYLAGRLHEEDGRAARALGLYEECLLLDRAPVAARTRLARLYLKTGWAARAREVWTSDAADALDERARRELSFRIAAAVDPIEETRERLDGIVSLLGAEVAATWAEEAALFADAAPLWRTAGKPGRALRALLEAGLWEQALAARGEVTLDDETALLLARLSGRASIITDHIGDRRDARATDLVRTTELSLGTRSVPRDDTARRPPDEEPSVELPDDDGSPPAGDPRRRAALDILRGGRDPGHVERLLSDTGAASLTAVVAFLTLKDATRARQEWVRWQLRPNPEERQRWLPVVRRLAPGWFPHVVNPSAILRRARRLGPDASAAERDAVVRDINRALSRAAAGSAGEARLLYHRGRLGRAQAEPQAAADLQRAQAIAPRLWVSYQDGDVRVELRARTAMHVARSGSVRLPDLKLPSPLDAALGDEQGDVLRISSMPLPGGSDWVLESWSDEEERFAPGFEWNATGATLGGVRFFHADRLAPLGGVLRIPGCGWLFVGHGMALLEERGSEPPNAVLRLEADEAWSVRALPEVARRLLPPEVAGLLGSLGDPPRRHWTELDRFLHGARLRARDPGLPITAMVAEGDRIVVRLKGGVRARFRRGVESGLGGRDTVPGYRLLGDTLLRADLEEAPQPVASAHPPVTGKLARAWTRDVALPTREQPRIDPIGPELPAERRLPEALADEIIVARRGDDPTVMVTGSGHVLYYTGEDPLPVWIGFHRPPLPGRLGYPLRPSPPPRFPAGRGPHLAGPFADARTPRIQFHGKHVLVLTDQVSIFDGSGRRQTLPSWLPSPRPVVELRDAALDPEGQAVFLLPSPGDSLLVFRGPSIMRVPLGGRSGAFDLQIAGLFLFVLGFEDGEFWARAEPVLGGPSRDVPLPPMEMETDREGLRITALGCWGERLLLLHDRLYMYPDLEGDGWRTLIEWPGHDPLRFPHYLQSAPRWYGGDLLVARPWGKIEAWRARE